MAVASTAAAKQAKFSVIAFGSRPAQCAVRMLARTWQAPRRMAADEDDMTKTRKTWAQRAGALLFSALTLVGMIEPMAATASAADSTPAKELFGSMKLPVRANPTSFGFYSKGCIAGPWRSRPMGRPGRPCACRATVAGVIRR